jgi:hypothetical protein
MSSGSFNINTFSWYHSLPLSTCATGYSTGTLFAVGPSSFEKPYSYYEYQNLTGFKDTSTLTTEFNSTLGGAIASTVCTLVDIYTSIPPILKSTIPYTKWISVNNISYYRDYPFQFSTFFSTTFGGFEVEFISECVETYTAPFDFISTYSDFVDTYDNSKIITSNVWIGPVMTQLIQSKKFDVYVDYNYSLYLSSPYTKYSWVSTTGFLGSNYGTVGRTAITRVGNEQYEHIRQSIIYKPQTIAEQTTPGVGQIGVIPSSFYLDIQMTSNNTTTSNIAPAFDIFVPGENNFTFTLIPVLPSNI